MRYVSYGLVFLLALVLQSFGPPGLIFWGVQPELVLLLALLFAIMEGPWDGAVFGFMGGFFQDLLGGRFVGLGALSAMSAALALGFIGRRLYKENLVVRFFTVLGGSWAAQILYLLGKAAFGQPSGWNYFTWKTILASGALNGLISIILFRPLECLNKRLIYWDELLKRTG